MSASGSKRRVALITGVTGEDGAYLAEYLLGLGYIVHGISVDRHRSTPRASNICIRICTRATPFLLHYGDMTDSTNLIRLMQQIRRPKYTISPPRATSLSASRAGIYGERRCVGVLRLLEAIRILGMEKKTRFYQASTSELYGLVQEVPQKETTPFYPRSPYAVAKLYGYWITINYREAYGMHASTASCSITRGRHAARRSSPERSRERCAYSDRPGEGLYLGNLDAKRDWGHAAITSKACT